MPKVFVVDVSTTLKWVFEDEIDSEKALNILKEYLELKIELIVPNIWIFEAANSVRTAYLRKRISIDEAKTKLQKLLKISPYLINIEDKTEYCLSNALNYNISVYDSAYITLAIINKVPLISSDTNLVNKIKNPEIALYLGDYKSPITI